MGPNRKLDGFKITVENRDYHHLSQSEIGGGKRISRHLSGSEGPGTQLGALQSNLLFAVSFHLQFAVIAANRIGNQCNQHSVRFRNSYCKASDRAVKNGLTKQQVLDVIKEVLY